MKKIFVISSFVLIFSLSLFANGSKIGTTAANFLKLGFGARPGAMGEAFTAAGDDISSIYYNPAGILNLENKHNLSFMHLEWLEDINYEWLSYIYKVSDNQKFGFTFSYLNSGNIPRYTEASRGLEQSGTYSASDKMFILTYSTNIDVLNRTIPFGLNLKLIRQDIAESSSTGFAVDLGILNKSRIFPVTYGLSVQNVGSISALHVESSPLPWNVRGGIKYDYSRFNLLTALDVIYPSDDDMYLNFGLEYRIPIDVSSVFIRAGFTSSANNSAKQAHSLGFGFGINSFAFDYAYQPFDYFDDTHKISLTYNFGKVDRPLHYSEDINIRNGYSRKVKYYNPSAEEVKIAGSFNNWDMSNNRLKKNGDDIWEITLDLPAGRYFYKLVVDNQIIYDPFNNENIADGMGGKNSVLYINEEKVPYSDI